MVKWLVLLQNQLWEKGEEQGWAEARGRGVRKKWLEIERCHRSPGYSREVTMVTDVHDV